MTVNLKLDVPTILSVLSALGGIAGIILGALGVGNMTSAVQAVITAVGGLLVAITGYHATSVLATSAAQKRTAALHQTTQST